MKTPGVRLRDTGKPGRSQCRQARDAEHGRGALVSTWRPRPALECKPPAAGSPRPRQGSCAHASKSQTTRLPSLEPCWSQREGGSLCEHMRQVLCLWPCCLGRRLRGRCAALLLQQRDVRDHVGQNEVSDLRVAEVDVLQVRHLPMPCPRPSRTRWSSTRIWLRPRHAHATTVWRLGVWSSRLEAWGRRPDRRRHPWESWCGRGPGVVPLGLRPPPAAPPTLGNPRPGAGGGWGEGDRGHRRLCPSGAEAAARAACPHGAPADVDARGRNPSTSATKAWLRHRAGSAIPRGGGDRLAVGTGRDTGRARIMTTACGSSWGRRRGDCFPQFSSGGEEERANTRHKGHARHEGAAGAAALAAPKRERGRRK